MNWFNQRYAVDRFIVNVPGWELPSSWNDAESLPEKGILTTRYYAGDGLCLKACRPRRKLRFALLANALVTLEDLRNEETEYYRSQEPSKIASIIPKTASTAAEVAEMLKTYCNANITWTYNSVGDCHP
jgi:hypothetical protein